MIGLLTHVLTHLSPQWHVSEGPWGWWVWFQTHIDMAGFGVERGHFVAAWQARWTN